MKFEASVELHGKTATGIEVPEDVVAGLGDSKRPAVTVSIGAHSYRTTVSRMGGHYLIPLSAENRTAAGVAAGDVVTVEIEPDAAPRTVEVPADLETALDAGTRAYFDGLAFTHRKEWVRWIEEAKRPETRADRVAKTVVALQERQGTR
jgi:Bacteriocin-protection, YdeI or OmpD-Associated/Domain of unknown function (DUF1905)